MPFIQHLKPALIKKGGTELTYDSVLFVNSNKDELIFSGTDNSKNQEPVRVTLNGSEINLVGLYLNEETPILKTGKSVKNMRGTPVNCSIICYDIIKAFRSGKLQQSAERARQNIGQNDIKTAATIQKRRIKKPKSSEIILPDFLKSLIENIRKLKDDIEHKERAHESLVELFYELLGYERFSEIKYQTGRIDVSIQIKGKTIIVNEVKRDWNLNWKNPEVVKQAYNYAHEVGSRFVIITNGDYYALFDQNNGFSYESHFVCEFNLSTLTKESVKFVEMMKKENLIENIG